MAGPIKLGAVASYDPERIWVDDVPVPQYRDIIIQGKMLEVNQTYMDFEFVSNTLGEDEIKRRMLSELMEEMLIAKVIEFTKQVNPVDGITHIRARCFLVPDTQVRILREAGF